jgi:hypothetical protein
MTSLFSKKYANRIGAIKAGRPEGGKTEKRKKRSIFREAALMYIKHETQQKPALT